MNALIWIVAVLFLWGSGSLVWRSLRLRIADDPIVVLALQIAIGLSLWPIVFLLAKTAGVTMTIGAMAVLVYGVIVTHLVLLARRRASRWFRVRESWPLIVTFLLLAILAIVTRISHIEGLAFPPWVDGVQHAMTIRLLLEQGIVPATADPYITGAPFFYHWGFHATAAMLASATGAWGPSDTPGFLLQYGQVLNALSGIVVYAAGRVLFRSRSAGLLSSALAMFVSYYPAFYLSWGRYTHLAGTLVLPPLLIALWRLGSATRRARMIAWTIASALLASGLVLIHVRIALFALLFALPMALARWRQAPRVVWRWTLVALLALVITSPWLATIVRTPRFDEVTAPSATRELPMPLLTSTRNAELFALATGGVSGMAGWLPMPLWERVVAGVWWLALILVARFGRKTTFAPWRALVLLAAWLALVVLTLYLRPAGLDLTRFATLDSAVITLYLPLSLAGAALIVWVLKSLRIPASAMLALIAAIAVTGAALTTRIVNEATIFADAADLRALRWIETHVPRDAVFAVDSRAWMPPSRVGVDGGYWLHVSTGRRSILPPLLYAWSMPAEQVDATNALLERWSSTSPDWRQLRDAGVTHIYVGARGSEAKRELLMRTNRVKLLHRDGGAMVFLIR